MMKITVTVLLALACLVLYAAAEHAIEADDSKGIIINVDPGQDVWIKVGDADPVSLLGQLEAISTMQTTLSTLGDRVTTLETTTPDSFSDEVNKAINRHVAMHEWATHDPARPDTIMYLGTARVDEVLQMTFTDSGCNSFFGFAVTLTGVYNAAPTLSTFGASDKTLFQRFKFYYRKTSASEFALAVKITGWTTACPSGDSTHETNVIVSSSGPAFKLGPLNQQTDLSPYTLLTINSVSDIPSEEDISEVVNSVVNRYPGEHQWDSHSATDPDEFILLGTAHTSTLIRIDLQDTGCNSGIGMSFQLSATHGTHLDREPIVRTLGSARDDLEDRFSFWWKATAPNMYQLALFIKGWNTQSACNPTHTTKWVLTTSDDGFTPQTGTANKADFAEIEILSLSDVATSAITADQVKSTALAAVHFYEGEQKWDSHDPPQTSDTFFVLGTAHVNEILHLDIEDYGCQSGIGLSYTITATYGLQLDNNDDREPVANTFGFRRKDLADQFTIYYKALSQNTYNLAVHVAGFKNPCQSTQHTTSWAIRSSTGKFVPAQDSAGTMSEFTKMIVNSMDQLDLSPQIASQLNRYAGTHQWQSHTNGDGSDPGTFIYFGLMHVDEVIDLYLEENGCYSGVGIHWSIQATWGVKTRNRPPFALTLGSAMPSISDTFHVKYYPVDDTTYHLAVAIDGWDNSCGNKNHVASYVLQSSTGKMQVAADTQVTPVAETEYKDARSESFMGTLNSLDARIAQLSGRFMGKKSWVSNRPTTEGTIDLFTLLGLGDVDEVLHVDIEDTGCYSGFGASFMIANSWGPNQPPYSISFEPNDSARQAYQNRIKFYYKHVDNEKYQIALYIQGWDFWCNLNAKTSGTHTTTYTIGTSSGTFVPQTDNVNIADFTEMVMHEFQSV